jgi:hypothetical protein
MPVNPPVPESRVTLRPSLSAQTKQPAWIVKARRNGGRLGHCPVPLRSRWNSAAATP